MPSVDSVVGSVFHGESPLLTTRQPSENLKEQSFIPRGVHHRRVLIGALVLYIATM